MKGEFRFVYNSDRYDETVAFYRDGLQLALLDPNQLDPSGGTAIDFYVASLDGKKAAISISKGGSERGDLHIYDVETAQPLGDVIGRVLRLSVQYRPLDISALTSVVHLWPPVPTSYFLPA